MRFDTSRHAEKAEMEMTPMIDVTFLLLIFFLCTLKFKTLEGRLAAHLPRDVGPNAVQSNPPEEVEVRLFVVDPGTRLDARGEAPWSQRAGTRYTFAADRRLEYTIGPRRFGDLRGVEARLTQLRRADPERKAVLAPDSGVVHQEVVEVLDALLESGFAEVRLQGAPEDR